MKKALITTIVWAGAFCVSALAQGTPKIQFDQTVYDFGKTSQVTSVSGVFKFKNTGDAVLKLEQPKPSCGCTVAALKSDTLKPGEDGELSFTLNLGRSKASLQKHITVKSNDPTTPQLDLTVKADYTPLYDVSPTTLAPNIPLGGKDSNQIITITRTDGKPLPSVKLHPSKPWITTKLDSAKPGDNSVRAHIEVEPDGLPRRFNEYIQVFLGDETNSPASTVFVYGRLMGELNLSPEALYWSVTDPEKLKTEKPEALVTRRISIRSSGGKPFEIKDAVSSISGLNVEVQSKEWKKPAQGGKPEEVEKGYELVAKLNDVPEKTLTGKVTFGTSVATQPTVEVPVTIYVYQPPKPRPSATNVVQRTVSSGPVTPPAPVVK